MAGITQAQAEAKLSAAMDAVDSILTSQEYKSGGFSQRRADLDAAQRAVTYWDRMVKRLAGGGIRVVGATPI